MYGCETWCFTLWEEKRVRLFENSVLIGVFKGGSDRRMEKTVK
jgi:hypothetical protein